ncbi:hypothetical protein PIB30_082654 [Stylosanthes scabra]|uniref:Uncharacterized protein n=1 Tax=Stylosanthes scabra TaxID=79078 RepID=A0ABU6RST8_9FABA|nr:hypothetical protein [Stylosanthes scabra]
MQFFLLNDRYYVRNNLKGVADLTATSSRDFLFKLRNFEVNRAKIAEERQKYGLQEVSHADENKGKEEELATKGKNKGISPEQPGSSKSKDLDHANPTANKNQGPQGEPERAAVNIYDSTKRDSTDKLQRMLDAIRIRKETVQSTSVTQQRGSANSAQSEGNQGQVDNVQLTQERVQEIEEDISLPTLEPEPQPDGDTMDGDGSEMGKGRPTLKATTIDEFLKENGIAWRFMKTITNM